MDSVKKKKKNATSNDGQVKEPISEVRRERESLVKGKYKRPCLHVLKET